MKTRHVFRGVMLLTVTIGMLAPAKLVAQDEESPFSVGADLVSSYIWRGTKFGTGPAIQPYIELALGNFAVGGWGSYCFTTNEGAEADLYASYGFDFGASIGFTSYYFPGEGSDFFEFTNTDSIGSHAYELNLGYETGGLSIAANYIFNEAGVAASAGGDMYFELGYSFDSFGLFVGAGDGWHTSDGEFAVCNIGVTSSADLSITDSFSLPVTGSVILNPEKKQFHVVFGISF